MADKGEGGESIAATTAGSDNPVVGCATSAPLQKRKPNPRVPVAKVQQFFTVLSETCNVKHAARVAGIHAETLYARRRRHPAFAETWRQALAIGYERLEEELLRLSLASLTGEGPSLFDPQEAIRPGTGLAPKAGGSPDVQMALLLLNKHRGTVEGTARPNANSKRATSAETDAWLEKRLDGLAKRLAAVAK